VGGEFRRTDAHTPVVLMGYANPIERFELRDGAGSFVAAAADAGVDGVLVVDYPPEECEAFAQRLARARPGPDLPARAHLHRGSAWSRWARVATRLRVLRVAQGRDRGRPPGHRRRGAGAAAHPRAREACRWAWVSASATRPPPRAVAQVADAVVIGSRLVQILEAAPRDSAAAGGARLHGRDPRRAWTPAGSGRWRIDGPRR
jgi:tryptophan synthase alpha chain